MHCVMMSVPITDGVKVIVLPEDRQLGWCHSMNAEPLGNTGGSDSHKQCMGQTIEQHNPLDSLFSYGTHIGDI